MAKGVPATPRFGAYLAELRESTQGKQSSLESVAQKLSEEELNGRPVHKSTLWNYEQGRAPNAAILWGLARLYDQSPLRLLEQLVAEWRGKDLEERERTTERHLTKQEREVIGAFGLLLAEDRERVIALLQKLAKATTPPEWFQDGKYVGEERRQAG